MDLASKKLLLTIATLVLTIVASVTGVDKDVITLIVGLVGSYNVGQGMADMGKGAKTAEAVQLKAMTTDLHARLDGVERTVRVALTGADKFKP